MVEVSVIIVSYRCEDSLRDTLTSVLAQEIPGGMEVIVVDNNSNDGTATAARSFINVNVIESDKNLGFSAGNNLGVRHSSGKYLFILNPDVILPIGIIKQLVTELIKSPNIGAVGPKVVDSNGDLQKYCARGSLNKRVIFAELVGITRTFVGRVLESGYLFKNSFYDDGPKNIDALSGCCMMVRKSAYNEISGFDEGYFLMAEDVDLCVRLKRAGHQLIYTPIGPVVHLTGQSRGVGNPIVAFEGNRSLLRYSAKWFSPFSASMLNFAYTLSLFSRLIISRVFTPISSKWRARGDFYNKVLKLHLGIDTIER